MRYQDLIVEEIVGKYAVVYHRTHTHENIAAIRADGFQAGPRAMYGRGIYATYELISQFNEYMLEQYGPFIIKSRVNLDGFLILERKVAVKVYGKAGSSIAAQVRARFKPGRYGDDNRFRDMQTQIEQDGVPSSQIARDIVDNKMITGMRGIVYYGRRDGACVVSYESDTILPMAWAEMNETDMAVIRQHEKPGLAQREQVGKLTWTKVATRALVARSMRPNIERDLVTNPSVIKSIPAPSLEQQLIAVEADPLSIRFIHDPAPEVQVTATMGDTNAIHLIADPVPEAIIWPLKTSLDNEKLMSRLPPETVLAALRLDCTIIMSVGKYNPDHLPTPAQWEAAWEAPNTEEMITILLRLHPDSQMIDARTLPQAGLAKLLHRKPHQLYHFSHASPALVATAVLSPEETGFSGGRNVALGNCVSHGRPVDTSAVPADRLAEIIKTAPNFIFAVAEPSYDLVKLAMQTSRRTAAEIAQRYELPPELQALAPTTRIFN